MTTAAIELMSNRSSPVPRPNWRRPVVFAMIWIGLAVSVMAQTPGTPPAEARIPKPSEPPANGPLSPAQCPSQNFLAGTSDDFSPQSLEPAAPSVALQTAVGGPFADFDSTKQDVHFVHTFRFPPCKCIVGAKIEFRAKALGSSGSSSSGNDSITLGFSTLAGFPHWSAHLGTGNPSSAPALSTPAWGSPPLVRTFSLDLAALPTATPGTTISLLSAMQTNKYLDFYVQDDTSIDYIKLTLIMCDCCHQPEKESGKPNSSDT
jgi:hypothetical protein